MAGPGNVLIKIGADAGQAVSELGRLNNAFGDNMTRSQKMAATLKKAAIPAAAALGAIGIGAKKAIDSASELNEQINKTATVFGPAGDEVNSWSKTLVHSFGISQRAALEAAGTFGNMLVPMGFGRKEAAKMSESLVQLAGDLASFNNASPEETLEALRSGLAGETEPLRKFGVFLNDTRLKQEALKQGLYDGKGALDAHAKAAATMALILKDTGDAQGDFAKTADSAANQERIQAAMTENLSAQLGQALLPAYQAVQKILIKVTSAMSEHTGAVKIAVGVVAALAGGILVANAAMKAYEALMLAVKAATAIWTAAQWLLNAALTANPIGLVIVALAALAAGIVIAYQKSETFRNIVAGAMDAVKAAVNKLDAAFDALLAAAKSAFNWVIEHWKVALFAFGPVGAAVALIASNFDAIKSAASTAFNFVTSVWNVGKFAFGPIEAAIRGIASAFEAVYSAVANAIGQIRSLISWIGKIDFGLLGKVGGIINKIPHAIIPAAAGPQTRALGAPAATSGGTTINVYGPIDPEGTARAILKVLKAHERRMGLA